MALKEDKNKGRMPSIPEGKVELIPIEKIIPYAKNPRLNDKTVELLMKSIADFGFNVPLILEEKSNHIICGHARWRAAKNLHIKELPCIRVSDLSEEQVKAFRLADNKVSEVARWNEKLLKIEFDSFEKEFDASEFEHEFNFADYGFEPLEEKKYDDEAKAGALKGDFIVSPFSIIDGTSPDNLVLDVKWKAFLKGHQIDYPPHLVEILFRWFTPEEGVILDPFYKSETKRYMSGIMGYNYKDDVEKVEGEADMVYLDLLKGVTPGMELSQWFKDIEKCIDVLADDRFVVAHVQERRSETYGYRSQIACELEQFMREHGFFYYNEIIYITRGLDAIEDDHQKFLNARIVPERHRSILVFFKGKVRNIRNNFNPIVQEYVGGDV